MLASFCFFLTLVAYWGSKRLYRLVPAVYLSPLLITPAAVILLIVWLRIPYDTYQSGSRLISGMIGPGTVAFAVPLYKNFGILKKHATVVLLSVGCGALAAVCTSALIAKWLHLTANITDSLAPRSATTPIAMAISQIVGGIPNITAVFVMVTGLLGMVLGPLVIRTFHITNEVARGVLFGTSSHNAGTAKAFEFSQVSGTVSSIAMILTAFITLCTAPFLIRLIS